MDINTTEISSPAHARTLADNSRIVEVGEPQIPAIEVRHLLLIVVALRDADVHVGAATREHLCVWNMGRASQVEVVSVCARARALRNQCVGTLGPSV